jgi:hypothetical protein
MGLRAFRGRPFEHTHENRAFNELFDLLDAQTHDILGIRSFKGSLKVNEKGNIDEC